jgi:hypothetical protein
MRDVRDTLTGSDLDPAKAQALQDAGLLHETVEPDGSSKLRVTDDAIPLLQPTVQRALAIHPDKLAYTQTPGNPADAFAAHVQRGLQRLSENAQSVQTSNASPRAAAEVAESGSKQSSAEHPDAAAPQPENLLTESVPGVDGQAGASESTGSSRSNAGAASDIAGSELAKAADTLAERPRAVLLAHLHGATPEQIGRDYLGGADAGTARRIIDAISARAKAHLTESTPEAPGETPAGMRPAASAESADPQRLPQPQSQSESEPAAELQPVSAPPDPSEPEGPHAGVPDPSAAPAELYDAQQIIADLQPHVQRLPEFQSLAKELDSIAARLESLVFGTAEHNQHYFKLSRRRAELIKLRDSFLAETRAKVALPSAHRGSLPVLGSIPPEIGPPAKAGREIVESYVHASLLPKTEFESVAFGERGNYKNGTAYLSPDHGPLRAAHEIVHGIEANHPEVLNKCRAFLAHRATGENPVPLKQLDPDGNYRDWEMAYEDEWVARGGRVYSGKVYPEGYNATEILSTGIERLHRNPALFLATDPEYFSFVVNTLRNL